MARTCSSQPLSAPRDTLPAAAPVYSTTRWRLMRTCKTICCAGATAVAMILSVGCGSKPGTPTAAGKAVEGHAAGEPKPSGAVADQKANANAGGNETKKAFLDQKKEIPAKKEWTREITSRRGGTVTFRITAPGPFAATVVTDRAYKALQSGQKGNKADILLTVDSKEPVLEMSLTVPAGSSWFIIENQTDQAAEIRLECFQP
ncbi:hypothetical protein R5W24_003034 [Gemmata sp. JC717]|uniref:hypothetical protein n=1 Tax=Gemmata algarum TaxID=2975278 RepID=UPI0021BB82C3|nr:hypothetical protein [Gemmata algarum]MDY3553920.1 hypothetical protein [Gemmata algarum]